jgi:hypothetical protein
VVCLGPAVWLSTPWHCARAAPGSPGVGGTGWRSSGEVGREACRGSVRESALKQGGPRQTDFLSVLFYVLSRCWAFLDEGGLGFGV